MQWFLYIDGQQRGPLPLAEAQQLAAQHPQAMCWRSGLPQWLPVADMDELRAPTPADDGAPPPIGGAIRAAAASRADALDFVIYGDSMQFVEVRLDPGESAVAEAGAMMYKDASVSMDAVFGDGSRGQAGGLMGKLVGAGKRMLAGESLFTTVFTQGGNGRGRVAFAAPYPGSIVPISLASLGGTVICQKDSFLAAARGVAIGIHFQKRILTGLFGGEGFVMQRLDGDGMVFLHAGGTLREVSLAAGETLHVDTGCLVAMDPGVDFDVEQAGGVRSMLFAGEGVFFARLRGPGRVWLQSLPFSRLAGRMHQALGADQGSTRG